MYDTRVNNQRHAGPGVPAWIKVGGALAGGAAAGLGGALLIGGIKAQAAEIPADDEGAVDDVVEPVEGAGNEWTDGEVAVAHGVNDGMSFGEAFAAARAEVGAGGAFEWRGGIYGTYTENEWNSMSPAERAEYGSHFDWGGISSEPENDPSANVGVGAETGVHGDDRPVSDPEEEHSYEIIRIHESEDGTVTAYGTEDGHICVLVDSDGDGVFDTKYVDLNDDGSLQAGEQLSIPASAGLTVDWAIDSLEPVEPEDDYDPREEEESAEVLPDDDEPVDDGMDAEDDLTDYSDI